MISYELDKQLKDAGFPQEKKDGHYYTEKSAIINAGIRVVDPVSCYAPTLSELIEACGNKVKQIRLWCNFLRKEYAIQLDEQGLDDVTWYPTPEEAVAKLWLALHGKTD
jgi:hypothetical protein